MAAVCGPHGALYQRYSDDILIICRVEEEESIRDALVTTMNAHKLVTNDEKTERAIFDAANSQVFQYLGFNLTPKRATIRPSSLARQWRKLKYSIAKTRKIAAKAIAEGRADKIYTKRLRRRFSPVGVRNFSAYARRAALAFGSRKIVQQVMRLEREADEAIRELTK